MSGRADLVIGVTPAHQPSAALCRAVTQAGGLGVLDLGIGDRAARGELVKAVRAGEIGLRVPAGCALTFADVADLLGDRVNVVLLGVDSPWSPADLPDGTLVLVEVTSVAEAVVAIADGADGLVARGNEAGGRVSELGSFVLLQHLLAHDAITVPVWACGGIGPHSAAAAVVGGAAGVVLDTQLALLPEADLRDDVRARISASDGTDTVLLDGHRVLGPVPSALPSITAALGRELLPVGQDCHLATRFAEYGSVAKAVRAVRFAVTAAIAADFGMDLDLGTRLPVAQGPMTRVSDQPGFAAAVAEEGGLPFVALALASGPDTRALLERTSAELGDRPWGVGVLGFAPDDVRAAQLAVIHEVRPPVALIAGGRPDQARALEAVGITTFLHVPSPGLLAQYLAEGAQNLVFEGAECGGHIGPRSSFSLWEAQLEVLIAHLDAGGTPPRVLFAGGVHDARSAAMVAALATPLTGRGVRVGVLMGTGYLFTEEAVAHGAVLRGFQRQVVAARRTELLSTAPGHVTRCVASPFTGRFQEIGAELSASGIAEREVWQRLEEINAGRLRIASKGLRRAGGELVEVDEAAQLADGLFMAGQVAVLRSAVTTIADLHADVTDRAVAWHAARTARLRVEHGVAVAEPPKPEPLDVAIVGMACVYPGSPDLASFWASVVGNHDQITEAPRDRLDGGWGGFIPSVPFDALRYGIPPAALAAIEPVQLLALEVARRALTDAGLDRPGWDRSTTSVVFGAEAGSEVATATALRTVLPSYLGSIPEDLAAQLPELTEDTFPGRLANVIAGRIANRLDLGGTNFTVDAACGSSLAAVDAGCKELVAGTSDVVLCGGADLHNSREDFALFASVGALSPTGRCRPFDSAADGIALGEGVACVVLKRLADAERDGDRVYAVIKGVGSGSDGKALGLTAPRPEGQRRALTRAYRNAGVSPALVGLVEAHGTGTVVGDRTELETLTAVFTEAGAEPGSCALGSVKSQIGHTKCAAGLAGLIKSAMALHTGVRPPTRNISVPNPAWSPSSSPFVFHSTAVPWASPARFAGVSAFGFGGTNFHVVLAGHATSPTTGLNRWPAELFLFRGVDPAVAIRRAERLRTLISANDAAGRPWTLRDLAKTVAEQRDPAPVQLAVVATDLDQLATLLSAASVGAYHVSPVVHSVSSYPQSAAETATPPVLSVSLDTLAKGSPPGAGGGCVDAREAGANSRETVANADGAGVRNGLYWAGGVRGKVAVLFPGQGSQRTGMAAELAIALPGVLDGLDAAEAAALFPAAAFTPDETRAQRDRLRDTRIAQPTLGAVGLAVHQVLSRVGLRADMYGGHSYGELVALTASGAIPADALPALSRARAASILTAAGADPGGMAAVTAGADDIAGLLGPDVVVANHNSPLQVVIAGPTAALAAAVTAVRAGGFTVTELPVACAFHTTVVAEAVELFADVLAELPVDAPDCPVWTNRQALPYPTDPAEIRAELAAQVGAPVRFADQIEAMYADGARVFVEAGPGRVLSGLVDAVLGDRPHTTVSTGDGIADLLHAIAALAVSGLDIRIGRLFSGRDATVVGGTPPARPGWLIDGHLVRTADGVPVGMAPARQITGGLQTALPDREAMISDFLTAGRELVAAQRDVLLGYLGAAPIVDTRLIDTRPPVTVPVVEAAVVRVETPTVLDTVLQVISERTGYPVDMIEPDLDLEADLSVDSIKRTEIVGTLATRLGYDGSRDELVRARTATALADALGDPATPEPLADTPEPQAEVTGVAPTRFAIEPIDAVESLVDPTALIGATILVAGGHACLAEEIAGQLSAHGAVPLVYGGRDPLDDRVTPVHGVISLHATEPGTEPVLPAIFPLLRSALLRQPRWCVTVSTGTVAGAGLRGFARSAQREYPDAVVRTVEVDPDAGTDAMAEAVVTELLTKLSDPVISVRGETRRTIRTVPVGLGALAGSGAGPAGTGAAETAAIGLDSSSVLLLLGGARGITAGFAAAIAEATRCRIVLAGRTTPVPEAPGLASARDLPALRSALAGLGTPAEIDRRAREVLAVREVEATMATLRRLGSDVDYQQVDARDPAAVRQLVKQVHAEHGRLDGVVHAAGVIEDRLIADKDPASFTRVFSTKVDGATGLLDALAELPGRPAFVLLFGSIAAAFGNRGQADYAAANDAVDSLAAHWADSTGGRALTVHWGPWAPGAGMVSVELGRSYADRGIAMIDPAEGVASLLRELAWGDPAVRSVVYTASGW